MNADKKIEALANACFFLSGLERGF